jgi:DNA-binding LytR/AlgR family response regulator
MDLLEIFKQTDKEINDAIKELHDSSISRFKEAIDVNSLLNKLNDNEIDFSKKALIKNKLEASVFNPFNIFYIRHTAERGIYRVHLLYPQKVLIFNNEKEISDYKVKFETMKEILKLLKLDFIRASSELIIHQQHITAIDTQNEKVIIRRFLPDAIIKKHNLKRDKELLGGRDYLKKIKAFGIRTNVVLSKQAKCDGFTKEFEVNGKLIINPLDICYIEKQDDIVTIQLRPDFITEHSRKIIWKNRDSIKKIIKHLNGDNILFQTHRKYVVNIYSLMSLPRLKGHTIKLLIDKKTDKYVEIPVSDSYKKEIEILLLSINYSNYENKVFEICNFKKKETEKLLKAKRNGEVEIHIISHSEDNPDSKNWTLIGEKENIGKVYFERINK